MLFKLIPLLHGGLRQTLQQAIYFGMNIRQFRDLFACENKEHGALGFAIPQKAINNVLLFSIAFPHEPFDAVSVVAPFEIAFGSTEHHLGWKRGRQRHGFENQRHSRHFERLSRRHQFFNALFTRQAFGPTQGFPPIFVFRLWSAHAYFFFPFVGAAAGCIP